MKKIRYLHHIFDEKEVQVVLHALRVQAEAGNEHARVIKEGIELAMIYDDNWEDVEISDEN